MKKMFFLVLFLLVSCSPSSIQEFQFEGECIALDILKILKQVESVSDLKREGAALKKDFETLVQVMIAANKFQNAHPSLEEPVAIGVEISELLKKEFIRIYQLEGCSLVMEGLQRESLHKLDLYHQRAEALKNEIYR